VRGKSVIWIWIIALLVTSLATAGISTSSPSTVLAIEPGMNTGDPGITFNVEVWVYDVTDLYAWNVRITFDPYVIKIDSIARGPFLETAGITEWFVWDIYHPSEPYGAINNTVGYLAVGDTLYPVGFPPNLPPNGATGSGKLLTITFSTNSTTRGVSPIHFEESGLTTILWISYPDVGTSVDIEHEALDSLFDNRVEFAAPVAMIYNPPMTGIMGMPVTFTSSSFDPDGWIVSEEWDFGDGENASGGVVEHAYATAGIYTVTLTVTDNDDATNSSTHGIEIFIWMEGGWVPDLVGFCSKPEHPDLNEAYGDRTLDLIGRVGNPTEEDYEVYVEFELYSKDEVELLGTLRTDVTPIPGGDIVDLSATFDTANNTWQCWSGGYWVEYGYYHWMMHKYIGFTRCYSRPNASEPWTEGYVRNYLSFHVKEVRHDIGVVDIWTNATFANPGDIVEVSVNVTNEGRMSETFTVPVTYDGNLIEDIEVTLAAGASQVLTTAWDTTGVDPDTYIIEAILPEICYERDVTDQSDYCVVFVVVV